ncbi:PTS sugar transporter subunit IIA [Lentilactobacillus hilgardii]|uniref:PTS sugar transporter subunit IIA n=1 Tax=Lentilactobacillus hilgardii TaxID=1588 RepID=UPI0039E81359
MKQIILATHGHLSEEFSNTLELIVGPIDNVRTFGMTKEKSEDNGKRELSQLIEESDEEQLIVITDLFGGSAANICAEFLMHGHTFRLLSGLNLPMLLTLITTDNDDISRDELADAVLKAGGDGIIDINKVLTEGAG